jgi:hypothetical protein
MDCVSVGRLVAQMIIELIGTWLIVGFFSAIGWNVADETVNKPFLDPWIVKKMGTGSEPTPPAAKDKDDTKN